MKQQDIVSIMEELATERPLFHSEADFQFALAWKIKEVLSTKSKNADVRLERRFDDVGKAQRTQMEVDLLVAIDNQEPIAFELKYYTKAGKRKLNNEMFNHKMHGGHSWGRMDFLEAVWRLEQLKNAGKCAEGYAILLTNDDNLRKQPHELSKNIENETFRELYIQGKIGGKSYTKYGKKDPKAMTKLPKISGTYDSRWEQYPGEYNFHYLITKV